jgi:hypothetical protein
MRRPAMSINSDPVATLDELRADLAWHVQAREELMASSEQLRRGGFSIPPEATPYLERLEETIMKLRTAIAATDKPMTAETRWMLLRRRPVAKLTPIPVNDGDHEHYVGDDGSRYERRLVFGTVASEQWYKMVPDIDEIDCTQMECPSDGNHEWDTAPPVTSSTGPARHCNKCAMFEEDILGDVESRLDRRHR